MRNIFIGLSWVQKVWGLLHFCSLAQTFNIKNSKRATNCFSSVMVPLILHSWSPSPTHTLPQLRVLNDLEQWLQLSPNNPSLWDQDSKCVFCVCPHLFLSPCYTLCLAAFSMHRLQRVMHPNMISTFPPIVLLMVTITTMGLLQWFMTPFF